MSTPVKKGDDTTLSKRVAELKSVLGAMTDFSRDKFEDENTKQECIDQVNAQSEKFRVLAEELDKRFTVSKDIVDEVVYFVKTINDGGGYNAVDNFNNEMFEQQGKLIMTTIAKS